MSGRPAVCMPSPSHPFAVRTVLPFRCRRWRRSDARCKEQILEFGKRRQSGGIAVHICAWIAVLAGPEEIFLSSTVKDLVVGSGIRFLIAEFTRSRVCRRKGGSSRSIWRRWPREGNGTVRSANPGRVVALLLCYSAPGDEG